MSGNPNSTGCGNRLARLLSIGLLGPALACAQPQPWSPPGASSFEVGQSMDVGGLALRIRGFVTQDSPERVLAAVRALAEGQPIAESTWQGRRVLGWLEAEHYVTVQVQPAGGGGSRGLWTAVPVRDSLRALAPSAAAPEAGWFPVGSDLSPAVRSRDGALEGRVLQAFNGHSTQVNADHLVRRLQAAGYHPEGPASTPSRSEPEADGAVLLFRGAQGAQATVLLRRDAPGRTSITLVLTGRQELLP